MNDDKMREEFEAWHKKEVAAFMGAGLTKPAQHMQDFKETMAAVWEASREALVIDFTACNIQHASYNNVDCYAITDVATILRRAGLEMKS